MWDYKDPLKRTSISWKPYPKGFVCLAAPFRRVGCVVFLVPREFRPVYAAAAGSISLITFDIRHFPDEAHL